MTILIKHHHAISAMLDDYLVELKPLLDWAKHCQAQNDIRDQFLICMPKFGKYSVKVEIKDGEWKIRVTAGDIVFDTWKVSISQEAADAIPQSVLASMVGMELGQVIEVDSKAIITKTMNAGMHLHLFTEERSAYLDIDEFLARHSKEQA
jgi:hypothetical protein